MGNYHGLIVYFYKKKRLCKNSLSYYFRLNPESHPGLIINASHIHHTLSMLWGYI
jgi:hypothetical protein